MLRISKFGLIFLTFFVALAVAGREGGGGLLADTPGMEFFTLWGVTPENLKDHFLDFVDLADGCRFRNCSHTTEAHCAVRGHVAASRYENYLDLLAKLKERFPHIVGPKKEDICYATQNRQEVLRALAREADVVLVVGSRNSSNSLRLAEVARGYGAVAHLIDDAGDMDPAWF